MPRLAAVRAVTRQGSSRKFPDDLSNRVELWPADVRTNDWVTDPRFVIGVTLAISGGMLNIWSDYRLWRLRMDNGGKYVIPRGGVFNLVSCPNLLGEIIEWVGFALLSWSLPGLAFALWTIANMVPRALWRHAWYRETFENYPLQRRAILPRLI